MSTHAPNEHGEDTYGEQTEKLQADAAEHKPTRHSAVTSPSPAQIKRWRRYLADEESEARIYRYLARRAEGTDREILLQVAEAEKRHQQHWRDMLGEHADVHMRPSMQSLVLQFLAKNFGSVFILAMAQRAESRSPYAEDPDATEEMAADEAIHEEIIRALATSGREKLSGNFRAAVFGANDGLVSNLALTMGITASGASSSMVLLSGIAGLLAGALSMAAGEFVSVRSQRELLDASQPTQVTLRVAHDLDLDSNELELIYRARGMEPDAAHHRAISLACRVYSRWCCLCCLWVRRWASPAAWWVCFRALPRSGAVFARF